MARGARPAGFFCRAIKIAARNRAPRHGPRAVLAPFARIERHLFPIGQMPQPGQPSRAPHSLEHCSQNRACHSC